MKTIDKLELQLQEEIRKRIEVEKELAHLKAEQLSRTLATKNVADNKSDILYDKDKLLKIQTKALEAAANTIVITNAEGDILWANPAFTKLTGFEFEEAIGQNPRVLKSGEHEQAYYEEMWKTITSGKVWKNEIINKRKDGTLYSEEMIITPVMGDDNKPHNFIAIKHDISGRKLKEENLARLNENLEQTAHRANMMAEKAQQASQAKSEFLATMSHEIRTPMNGIMGMTNLLLDTNMDQMQKQLANNVMLSAESLLSIINDILDFSKIEAGKFELELLPFDIYSAIDTVGSLLAVKANEQGIDLSIKIEPDLPQFLIGDVGRIQQVLTNLMSNAIKFTHQGHVLVNISLNEQIADKAEILFAVEDTGIGILPDRLESIFEIFTQADSSTTREFGGTGLGLTVSRQLVNMMGGTIEVQSTPKKGSVFSFNIPLKKDLSQSKSDMLMSDKSSVLNTSILFVAGKSSISRNAILKYLQSWRLNYESAETIQDAVFKFHNNNSLQKPFHVLLIDSSSTNIDEEKWSQEISVINNCTRPQIIRLESTANGIALDETKDKFDVLYNPVHPSTLMNALVKAELQYKQFMDQEIKSQNLTAGTNNTVAKHNARILLAEDHPINQRVAVLELEKFGCKVEVAENGKVAVDMFLKVPYDMVVMDINMPEMDGYDATKKIRSLEKGDRHTPIIAMTANAMQGDREKCLAAGMDDYISKPVHRSHLEKALQKWLPSDLLSIGEEKKEVQAFMPAAKSRTHLLLPVFDFDNCMERYDNDIELLQDIALEFVYDANERIIELAENILDDNCIAVGEMSHALKGGSSQVGAERLREASARLEEAGRNDQPEMFNKLFAIVKQELNDYNHHLNKFNWNVKNAN